MRRINTQSSASVGFFQFCDVPLPLLHAAAVFFAAFVVLFDALDAFAMIDFEI